MNSLSYRDILHKVQTEIYNLEDILKSPDKDKSFLIQQVKVLFSQIKEKLEGSDIKPFISHVYVYYNSGWKNQLYIRGEGNGLNWRKGIPLENIGRDKWVWKVHGLLSEGQFKIYINDNDRFYEDGQNQHLDNGMHHFVHHHLKFNKVPSRRQRRKNVYIKPNLQLNPSLETKALDILTNLKPLIVNLDKKLRNSDEKYWQTPVVTPGGIVFERDHALGNPNELIKKVVDQFKKLSEYFDNPNLTFNS